MKFEVRWATLDNIDYLARADSHLPMTTVKRKIEGHEYLVTVAEGEIVGHLRFSYFWSFIPFIDIVRVADTQQRRGAGRQMLAMLEERARSEGQILIMSSSQADESAPQRWHRHMGFRDAGALVALGPLQDVTEVVFIKHL